MGVLGLTSFLRENKTILARSLQLSTSHDPDRTQRTRLVVDAWSFIYEIVASAELPWVYGGEYPQFAVAVERVVRSWLDVGLEVHFVCDGPYPALKFPTLVSRITQNNIHAGLLFFRTSAIARAHPRFLREAAMLPPLMYNVCVDTLLRLVFELSPASLQNTPQSSGPLHVHFADAEGDPYAVALAGRLGAYVGGRDSDFVVLNTEGYAGYVPLDEMVWTLATPTPASSVWDGEGSVYSASTYSISEAGDVGDDGFQTVKKGKGKKRRGGAAAPTAHAVLEPGMDVVQGKGILSPSSPSPPPAHTPAQLTLTFPVYAPPTLAAHLGIPVSLLPLLGALLGNDFTAGHGAGAGAGEDSPPPPATTSELRFRGRSQNFQRLFFERGLSHQQRVHRVAGVLSGILADAFTGPAASGAAAVGKRVKARKARPIGSVMDLIDAAVTTLLVRPLDSFATGEREAVVERVAEATLQYAITRLEDEEEQEGGAGGGLSWVSDVCPLHTFETCPLVVNLSSFARTHGSGDADAIDALGGPRVHETRNQSDREAVRELYIDAYRRGRLDPHVLDAVHTGTTWPRPFLEDPDKECVQRSVGRSTRLWVYAILESGVGLPSRQEEEQVEETDETDEDEDELVDVVEEDSEDEEEASPGTDPLARLRGALKELDGEDDDDTTDADAAEPAAGPSSGDGIWPRRKVVTEYVRRGTRLAPEDIEVPWLGELLSESDDERPIQLSPPYARRSHLLQALDSTCQAVAELPDDDLIGVLAVRFVARTMHQRATESRGAKERMQERWTEAEAKIVLACLCERDTNASASQSASSEEEGRGSERAGVVERHVQLVAQVLVALDAVEQLTQVLLLADRVQSPARLFSGARCHALLSGRETLREGEPREDLWAACVDGLEDAFAASVHKKKTKKAQAQPPRPAALAAKGKPARGGMFGLLANIEG